MHVEWKGQCLQPQFDSSTCSVQRENWPPYPAAVGDWDSSVLVGGWKGVPTTRSCSETLRDGERFAYDSSSVQWNKLAAQLLQE